MNNDWYENKLKFKCTKCGKCCTGAPGVVWVDEKEIETIAHFLNLSIKEFSTRFLRKVNGRYALVELKKNFDCIFLKNNQCTIYEARPKQCRTFPFWPQNLASEKTWQETAKYCEGINEDAPIVENEVIVSCLNKQET